MLFWTPVLRRINSTYKAFICTVKVGFVHICVGGCVQTPVVTPVKSNRIYNALPVKTADTITES